MKRTIILDSNFLLIPFQFKINIFEEIERLLEGPHEIIVTSGVLKELKRLSKGKKRGSFAARVALKIIENNKEKIKLVKGNEKITDNEIIEIAARCEEPVVCTNDIILRRRLKKQGIRCIVLKGKTKIDFE